VKVRGGVGEGEDVASWLSPNVFALVLFQATILAVLKLVNNSPNLRQTSISHQEKS
jgi:hypothetical protein